MSNNKKESESVEPFQIIMSERELILTRFRHNQKVTDKELELLRADMSMLSQILSQYGDLFALPATFATQMRLACEQESVARKVQANPYIIN